MKKIMLGVAVALAAVFFMGPTSFAATTSVNEADISAAETALSAVNSFNDSIASHSTADVQTNATLAEQELDTLSAHTFNKDGGAQYIQASKKLKQDGQTLKTDIQKLAAAVATGDNTTANALIDTYNTDIGTFNDDIQAVNSAVDTTNHTNAVKTKTVSVLYIVLFVITIFVSVATFLWAIKRKSLDPLQAKAQKRLARISLAPVAGAGITLVTFYVASKNGGTYYIAYGPIIFGVAAYVGGILNYKRNHSTASGGLTPSAPGTQMPYGPQPLVPTPFQPQPTFPQQSPAVPVTPVAPVLPPVPATPDAYQPPQPVVQSVPTAPDYTAQPAAPTVVVPGPTETPPQPPVNPYQNQQ